MKIVKKNQVVIAVIGLMLIAAGYLNFSNNSRMNSNGLLETATLADSEKMASIGDAQLVNSKPTEENKKDNNEEKNNTIKNENDTKNSTNKENNNSEILTSSQEIKGDEYFTKSRLERETMYSQMIESYQKILLNTNISESQKQTAQKQIKVINEQKNAIMITENLLKTKGFEDLIIFVNDKSINVIVKAKKIEKDKIAQIQNIITRELKANIENIHISNRE